MKGILLTFLNVLLILFTVLVHKIIFRILGLGYDSLVLYWGLFVLIFFIFDVISNSFFIKKF
ncbi:MAG: bacteriocin-like WGxF protein [Anaerostipes hadrus]|nr:bacteriocin-like WGxF protein [Anaerostipes hadrus]